VKDELLQADPTLGPRLFHAFKAAKTAFLDRLAAGTDLSVEEQVLARRRSLIGDDPLPYGLERNRKAMEAIVRFAVAQKILPQPLPVEDLFARTTLNLE
jgi:4,5-dihydroxyphthalate decarboxylase